MATGTARAKTSAGQAGGVMPFSCDRLKVAVGSSAPAISGDVATGISSDCASGYAEDSITGVDTVDICSSCGWLKVLSKRKVLSGIHHGVWIWTSQPMRL